MTIHTYNAHTLTSEEATEDRMVQARKINYDVIELTEMRRRHPHNAIYETGVGVLVSKRMVKKINLEQLTTQIERLQMRRSDSTPPLTISVVYAPTPSYEEVDALYEDLQKNIRDEFAKFVFDKIKPGFQASELLRTSLGGFKTLLLSYSHPPSFLAAPY
ncbi:hypothetical protein NECAME_14614 [Necator americanus]|uniref:Uncharacterized protein n=1 Tax=Necator americanus TaxID=51031 RepID=W2SM83_NECAM|nr:hypothetical protein NECAME_14614 [Necator americanus]ETN70653.1 hypothetical protein NECAME_14614 [Necator americanus]